MATDSPDSRDTDGEPSDDEITDFLSLLNELKATGCSLLVVGDARPELFARASANLLGDPESLRYRVLAATDASPRSVATRLPNPEKSPRPLAETTRIVDYAATPRSAASTANLPAEFTSVPEVRVSDSDLDGLESTLVESIEAFGQHTADLRPATLRVGVDSVDTLLDYHGAEDVRECLRSLGERVRAHDGMAHYVLREPYGSERVAALEDAVDAVIEIRSVNPEVYGHDAQQRWHVSSRDLTVGWVRL